LCTPEGGRFTKGLKSPNARKPVKKTVKKTAKKSARDDIEDNYKEFKKFQDEIWAAIRENQKNIFGIKTTLDFFIEHIMSIDILKKFKKFGFSFDRLTEIKFAQGVYAEISAVYDDCIQAVVVIVTNTLLQSDIDDHLLRMEKIRKYADEHGDKRQFMGAMAATITDENTRNHALNKGLFIIEPSGEDVKVIKPEKEPRVW